MGDKGFLHLARRFNNISMKELQSCGYLPLMFGTTRIGTVSQETVAQLHAYPDVFLLHPDRLEFQPDLSDYEKRSEALRRVFLELRDKKVCRSLAGWRNECYETRLKFSQSPIFKVERSGSPILGLRQYGVHINGFVDLPENKKAIWVQRRSKTKPTYPGKLDSFVGGGLTEGLGVFETALKELEEEAGLALPAHLDLLPCGSVSFFHESERGVHPQTEFVFDLRLPEDFRPENNDGEVDDFMLVSSDQLLDIIRSQEYKTTSIPVALDWLIRHGLLTVEMEPDLTDLLAEIHTPLHSFYS